MKSSLLALLALLSLLLLATVPVPVSSEEHTAWSGNVRGSVQGRRSMAAEEPSVSVSANKNASANAAAAKILQFTCPAVGSNPIQLPEDTSLTQVAYKIPRALSNTLCLLVKVSVTSTGTAHTPPLLPTSLTSISKSSDYDLIPLARSYSGWDWSLSSGIIAETTWIKIRCRDAPRHCNVRVEREDPVITPHAYYLMTLSHSQPLGLTSEEIKSRFLNQVTFGATREEMTMLQTKYNIGVNIDNGTANQGMVMYLSHQMNPLFTPITSHREYYRSRVNFDMKWNGIEGSNIAPQHPCDAFSRWIGYSVTGHDYGLQFKMTTISSGSMAGKLLMSVLQGGKWTPRTIMDSFADTKDAISGPGNYAFCYSHGSALGEEVAFRRISPPSGCATKIEGGNPPLVLPAEYWNDGDGVAITGIHLPDLSSGFEFIAGQWTMHRQRMSTGESYRMYNSIHTESASQVKCNALTMSNANYKHLLGILPDGNHVQYNAYAAVEHNTPDDPITDGGVRAKGMGMRNCANVNKNDWNIDSCRLSTSSACVSSAINSSGKIDTNVVICGSPGEISNERNIPYTDIDTIDQNTMAHYFDSAGGPLFGLHTWQKSNLFNNIALYSEDQLRQRMGWALSQILVVTQFQIDNSDLSTEFFLHYHDIFVRNAFGNYFDILKEVSYSPMMGEMLSFLGSQSASYTKRVENRDGRPDENYAREIMQLFSVGIWRLNMDGSKVTDGDGNFIPTYDNTDIQNYARAWTGFNRQNRRANFEGYWHTVNRIDPMGIYGPKRDPFPKTNLIGGYIGDKYPLCTNTPKLHFLKKGAEYRLLGGHDMPETTYEPSSWSGNENLKRFELEPGGALYRQLCNEDYATGACKYPPRVVLTENLICDNDECTVDNFRIVQVGAGIHYEYIPSACVFMAFGYGEKMQKVRDRKKQTMCLHEKVDNAAMSSCCPINPAIAIHRCEYTAERTSFATSVERCKFDPDSPVIGAGTMCDGFPNAPTQIGSECSFNAGGDYMDWHWSLPSNSTSPKPIGERCVQQAKIDVNGNVAIVHAPDMTNTPDDINVFEPVDEENSNYFKVQWMKKDKLYPGPDATTGICNPAYPCTLANDGSCLCTVDIFEKRSWSGKRFRDLVSTNKISKMKKRLMVGALSPDTYPGDYYARDTEFPEGGRVQIYHYLKGSGDPPDKRYTRNAIIGIRPSDSDGDSMDDYKWFMNFRSLVKIGTNFVFRNPPHFMSLAMPDSRDAHQETEAVLKSYFHHPNTAPFVAQRIMQRFGFSNPSPRFVFEAAEAFKSGTYVKLGVTFGDGKYGNMGAMLAAILLDHEARDPIVDADPTSGSLREPFLKLLSFMRSMDFKPSSRATAIRFENIQAAIGQAPYVIPNVFSFFLPEYQAPGQIQRTGLKSPEAQVMNAPTIVGFLNGLLSMLDVGLSDCYSGFGGRTVWNCAGFEKGWFSDFDDYNHGSIKYEPTGGSTATGAAVVDELVTLLLGGRVDDTVRATIAAEYDNFTDKGKAKLYAQKMMLGLPEFHSSNVVLRDHATARAEAPAPVASANPYKAIIFLNLHGGMDGFNMLVPNCPDQFKDYQDARGEIALLNRDLLTIQTTGQADCNTYGLHPKLTGLRDLYNEKSLSFIANLGILQEPVTKSDWRKKSGATALFAHNTQTEETAAVDIFDEYAGVGVGGRILDAMFAKNFKPGAVSVSGSAPPVVAKSSPLLVVDPSGYEEFDPVPFGTRMTDHFKNANPSTTVGSGLFSETYSKSLFQSLSENALLFAKYNAVKLTNTFPATHVGRAMGSIAKLIQTKDDRGVDRDVFFAQKEGFDTHFDIEVPLQNLFQELDDGLSKFAKELKDKGLWDDVTVICVSEFGRTLMGNTGNGSDHAWGGNYFVMGGGVDGGKILGEYPTDLSNNSPLVFSPGIVLPTTPWESVWSAVSEWFGVTDPAEIAKILPNKDKFTGLWDAADIFKPGSFGAEEAASKNTEQNIFAEMYA